MALHIFALFQHPSFVRLFRFFEIMRFLALSLSAVFGASAIAVPTPDTHVLHEQHGPEVSRRWRKLARQEEVMGLPVPVRIGLKQSNLNQAHELLMDVYAFQRGRSRLLG
jgi:hypothetical protein